MLIDTGFVVISRTQTKKKTQKFPYRLTKIVITE